jgi:hypothetical protein
MAAPLAVKLGNGWKGMPPTCPADDVPIVAGRTGMVGVPVIKINVK